MTASLDSQGPPEEGATLVALPGGLRVSPEDEQAQTLSALPTGARLILRCRKDWRDATVSVITPEAVTLLVNSPSGRTYRVRRPPDAPLSFHGMIPILGEGCWQAGFARYDARW